MEVKYVFGMAACHHLLKEYESAIKLYALCSCLNPQDPLPYYHTSDCYMQQKDDKSALMSLKMCLKFAQDKNEFKDIYQRSLLTLSSLEKKFSPKK